MKFVSIKATNFLSFKDFVYDFKTHPVLIQGENLTEIESQESNGAGKTAIQCAVEYSLMAATSRKIKDSELIFWGEDSSEITLEAYCPIRGESLVIWRKISLKGSSKLEIKRRIDGKEIPVNFSTVNEGNKYILDWLDLSKEDIQNFFIVNKERYTSFFSSNNTKKIELISRFSNSDKINGVEKLVQEDVKGIEEEIKQLELNKSSVQGIIDDSRLEIEKLNSEDFEEKKKQKISAKEQEIEQIQHDITKEKGLRIELTEKNKELNEKISNVSKSSEEVESKINDLKKVSFDEEYQEVDQELSSVNKEIEKKGKEKLTFKKSVNETEELIDEISKNIKSSVKCPKCNHEFLVGDPEVDIEEEKVQLKEAEGIYESTKNRLAKINNSLLELNEKYEEINSKKSVISEKEAENNKKIREWKRKLKDIEDEVDNIDKQITQNKNSIENSFSQEEYLNNKLASINKQIEEIKNQTGNEEEIKRLNDKINIKEKELKKLEDELKEKEKELYNTNQWVFNFKKFYGHLANKSLKILQGYANKYLQELNSDLQVKWEGFKVKADGTLSDKITPYIMRGGEVHDFWSFSGGERARLDFAMILTIQGIINSSHKYGGLDFISLDEVLEGIDGLGLGQLMKSVKNLEKTILLTTHVTDRNVHGDILLIKKINGVSTLN